MKKLLCFILSICSLCLANTQDPTVSAATQTQQLPVSPGPKLVETTIDIVPVRGHKCLEHQKPPYHLYITTWDTSKQKPNDKVQIVYSYKQDIKTGDWAYWFPPKGEDVKTTIEQKGNFTNEYFMGIIRNIRPLTSADTADNKTEDEF